MSSNLISYFEVYTLIFGLLSFDSSNLSCASYANVAQLARASDFQSEG